MLDGSPSGCNGILGASTLRYQIMPPKGKLQGLLINVGLAWAGGWFHLSNSTRPPLLTVPSFDERLKDNITHLWIEKGVVTSCCFWSKGYISSSHHTDNFWTLLVILPKLAQMWSWNSPFFEWILSIWFYQALGGTEKQLRENFTWKFQKFGLCMKCDKEDSRYLKLACKKPP